MSVTSNTDQYGIQHVMISGRFDFSCHRDFRAAIATLNKASKVVVDFGTTTYIDSAALGMLLLLRDYMGDVRSIRLANCKGQPDQVLRIANFHRLFGYDSTA